ncbi:protamine P1 family protein [Forsythia ovata]|uniref:Protamine P1 family protein n=1 Tax=Forsythia ovata TaxID=205694 RepID=A0ABD1WXL7_9LAMI
MRFLRSNAGSRSRGRSRSSPMFRMRSKKDAAPVIEPSSPKVTCFGQVQVTTSSRTTASRRPKNGSSSAPCWWLKKTLFCHKIISSKFHSCGGGGLSFGSGFCKKVDTIEDSCSLDSQIDRNCKNLEVQIQENKGDFHDSSPPNNALLLTRCRSAPYRSSSLAGQFWGSPLASTEIEYDTKIEAKSENEFQELQKPSCENVMLDSRRNQESENSVNNVQDSKENTAGGAVHPLLLTRCKSEPARTGERLYPEINFWRQRRLGVISPVHNIIQ